jgi:hypothetical protein
VAIDEWKSLPDQDIYEQKLYRSDTANAPQSLEKVFIPPFYHSQAPEISSRSNGHVQGMLTTHVWPKSRMLFAVVSKMSKEGVLNNKQRGILKDLILEYD